MSQTPLAPRGIKDRIEEEVFAHRRALGRLGDVNADVDRLARLEAQRMGWCADDGELSRLGVRHSQHLRSETSELPTQVCPPNGYSLRGPGFCSFLALVLRQELQARWEERGHDPEWADVIGDLDRLQMVEVEQDGKKFLLRSEVHRVEACPSSSGPRGLGFDGLWVLWYVGARGSRDCGAVVPRCGWPSRHRNEFRAEQGGSMLQDQGDDIAAALDRLHAGGWSVDDTAFYVEGSELVHVITGTNGENQIRAESATCVEAWRREFDQATTGELLGWSRSQRVGKYEREGEASFCPSFGCGQRCHVTWP